MSDGKKTVGEWLSTVEPVNAKACVSCREPWRSTIREVLEELAKGTAGSGVTLSALHRFLVSEAFDERYPLTLSALRAHVRHHEPALHAAWCARLGVSSDDR